MIIVRSRNGVPVRLTDERWGHLTRRHPEMKALRNAVLETVTAPDIVQEGDAGALLAIREEAKTPLTRKHIVVAYREVGREDGFILTAYLTSKPYEGRRVLWRR